MHEALRQILGKLDGLEDSLAKQGQGLRAVQHDVQAVKASQKELGERVEALHNEVKVVPGAAERAGGQAAARGGQRGLQARGDGGIRTEHDDLEQREPVAL